LFDGLQDFVTNNVNSTLELPDQKVQQ